MTTPDSFWQNISKEITRATGQRFTPTAVQQVGGGCISDAYLLSGKAPTAECKYFVKTNQLNTDPDSPKRFACEADALTTLAAPNVIGVPRPIAHGVCQARAFLAMEYIDFGHPDPTPDQHGQARLGEALAALHLTTESKHRHGWHQDNFIGATPQPNQWTSNWIEFLRTHRLGHQLHLAAENGFRGKLQTKGAQLLEKLDAFFPAQPPRPSLLHGDLWSGNYAIDRHGTPYIFDPATHYGDRESDLAMTELFGGFTPTFYAAYNTTAPLTTGYPTRKHLYQLYHLLNHANLFGGGYAAQAEGVVDWLLGEVG